MEDATVMIRWIWFRIKKVLLKDAVVEWFVALLFAALVSSLIAFVLMEMSNRVIR